MDNSNNKRQRFVTAFSVASTLLDASHEPSESSQQLQEVGTIAIPVLEQRTLSSKKEKNPKIQFMWLSRDRESVQSWAAGTGIVFLITTLCKSYEYTSNHTFSPYGSWGGTRNEFWYPELRV